MTNRTSSVTCENEPNSYDFCGYICFCQRQLWYTSKEQHQRKTYAVILSFFHIFSLPPCKKRITPLENFVFSLGRYARNSMMFLIILSVYIVGLTPLRFYYSTIRIICQYIYEIIYMKYLYFFQKNQDRKKRSGVATNKISALFLQNDRVKSCLIGFFHCQSILCHTAVRFSDNSRT